MAFIQELLVDYVSKFISKKLAYFYMNKTKHTQTFRLPNFEVSWFCSAVKITLTTGLSKCQQYYISLCCNLSTKEDGCQKYCQRSLWTLPYSN